LAYTKQGPFVNETPPALNATRANAMDQGIYDAHQLLDETGTARRAMAYAYGLITAGV
jgi:hypothetical protein